MLKRNQIVWPHGAQIAIIPSPRSIPRRPPSPSPSMAGGEPPSGRRMGKSAGDPQENPVLYEKTKSQTVARCSMMFL